MVIDLSKLAPPDPPRPRLVLRQVAGRLSVADGNVRLHEMIVKLGEVSREGPPIFRGPYPCQVKLTVPEDGRYDIEMMTHKELAVAASKDPKLAAALLDMGRAGARKLAEDAE